MMIMIKRLLLLAVLPLAGITAFGIPIDHYPVNQTSRSHHSLSYGSADRTEPMESFKAPVRSEAESVTLTVNVTIDEDSYDDFSNLLALQVVDGQLVYHMADLGPMHRLFGSGSFKFTLPAGIYDFMAVGHRENDEGSHCGTYIIYNENVRVYADSVINYKPEDAVLHTTFLRRGPEGQIMTFDDLEGTPKNCYQGDQTNTIDYKGFNLYKDNYTSNLEDFFDFWINARTSSLVLSHMDLVCSDLGIVTYVMPVDFSSEKIIPGTSNWQSANMEFAPTPMNTKYQAWGAESKNKLYYGTKFSTLINGELLDTAWLSLDKSQIKTGTILSWIPDGYNNKFELLVTPVGDVVGAPMKYNVEALPFRRAKEGIQLYQVGRNFMMQNLAVWSLRYSGDDVSLNSTNPRYSGTLGSALLANSTPAFVTIPLPSGMFEYSYIGRYGENLALDAAEMSANRNIGKTFLEYLDGYQTNDIKITINGEVACENRAAFDKFKYPDGKYKVEVTMPNVLIDGEIAGSNLTVMEFENKTPSPARPTVTALQFRTIADTVSDRFHSSNDGYLELYAGNFTAKTNPDLKYAYCDVDALAEITVEYSPAGKSLWEKLPVEEIPELFFMPGFGYCYRGSLSAVNRPSDNKWYDLRIKVANSAGAYQQQILSSAFRIEDTTDASVENISGADSERQTVHIYTIDGRVINGSVKELPAGIYLVRKGNSTSKHIVK